MRRAHDLIPEIQCPNWDTECDLSFGALWRRAKAASLRLSNLRALTKFRNELAAALVGLIIDLPRHLGQAVAIAGPGDHIADAAVGPEQGAFIGSVLVLARVTHLGRLGRRLGAVD